MMEASPRFSHKDFWESHDTAKPGEDWDIPGTTYGESSLYEDFPYIMQWDDSGAVEALSLAGKRQDAMAKGLPWISFLPHPGMYLEKINWDVRESWDMPDSADTFAAKEDKRHHSRNRGGRSHGRWRNHDVRIQDYRSREVGQLELPMHDVWPTDKNTPPSWDPLPVPTGWGDVAIEQGFPVGELAMVGGGWTDSEFSKQAVPCSSSRGQEGPSGWGSCRPTEDHAVSMGWGDQPVGPMQSQYDQQQTRFDQQQTQYDQQQTWTCSAWPAQHIQPSAPMLQQQHQRLLEQQQAHSPAVDVRWQNQRYPGQSVEPRPLPVPPDCRNSCGAPFQESLPGTLQQHNFQDRSEVGGGQKYRSSQHYGWDRGGAAENRSSGHRNMRDRSAYTVAPPPAQDVWKQQWQPVANIGHGTGVYY